MTQGEAAEWLGMSRRTYESWEIGRCGPQGFAQTLMLRLFELDGEQDVSPLLHGPQGIKAAEKRVRKRTENARKAVL
jgi:DNA-binding XRE family transcriptional regulator